MKNNITLIGMPGSGKSTVGVVLAKRLGRRFVDSDLVIQERHGKLLHELITEHGVEGFWQIESNVNASLNLENSIIAMSKNARIFFILFFLPSLFTTRSPSPLSFCPPCRLWRTDKKAATLDSIFPFRMSLSRRHLLFFLSHFSSIIFRKNLLGNEKSETVVCTIRAFSAQKVSHLFY